MSQPRIKAQIEQAEALVAEKKAALSKAKSSITREIRQAKSLTNSSDRSSKVKFINMKIASLDQAYDEVSEAQDKLLAILRGDVRDQFVKMKGLLSYGIATGQTSPDCRLLFDSLGDYLDARSDSDLKAAGRAVNLCLEHGNFGPQNDTTDADDKLISRFEAIIDSEERTAFHRKHQDALVAAWSGKQQNS